MLNFLTLGLHVRGVNYSPVFIHITILDGIETLLVGHSSIIFSLETSVILPVILVLTVSLRDINPILLMAERLQEYS